APASWERVVTGHCIAEGTHSSATGSNFIGKAEIDAVAVRRCESIVVDSKDQARLEAGDFVQPLEEGSIHWADIHELGQVIVGRYTGRAHSEDVTMFKSLGIAIEDVAVAQRVYDAARARGLGKGMDWGSGSIPRRFTADPAIFRAVVCPRLRIHVDRVRIALATAIDHVAHILELVHRLAIYPGPFELRLVREPLVVQSGRVHRA